MAFCDFGKSGFSGKNGKEGYKGEKGKDITIRELAETMKKVIGFNGDLFFDTTKPDGSPRKLIDVSRLSNMGWKFNTNLKEGLEITYKWYLSECIK